MKVEGACKARASWDCTGRAQHHHHIVRRSQGGKDSKDNLLPVCWVCHAWIHRNPAVSFDMGWLKHEWEGQVTP